MPNAKITALGCYTPPRVLTNPDLEQLIDTTDQWILDHTGIRERHLAAPDVATSDLALAAARCLLDQHGVAAADLDAILVCTVTPDHLFPSTAGLVQHGLGATRAWGFDLLAGCAGFLYGLNVAAQLVATGSHQKVLVIGADTMSRIVDYQRSNCVLFGDGAGAMLVEPAGDPDRGFGLLDFVGEVDGSGAAFLKQPAGGSRRPASQETLDRRLHFVHQDGARMLNYASAKLIGLSQLLLERNHLTVGDLALMIPNQSNQRMLQSVAAALGLPPERMMINIDRYGNTSGASVALATGDAVAEGRLKPGDLVLFAAAGGGFAAGASLWRWAF